MMIKSRGIGRVRARMFPDRRVDALRLYRQVRAHAEFIQARTLGLH